MHSAVINVLLKKRGVREDRELCVVSVICIPIELFFSTLENGKMAELVMA